MKKIILVFGTRPEAIKMCPIVKELRNHRDVQTLVCVTGQHRQMLDEVLDVFDVEVDYDLALMQPRQTLFDVTSKALDGMRVVLEAEQPDLVMVHGDTTTAFSAALAAYYMRIPVAHVEAGLRTHDVYSPYPEEFNRQAVGSIATLHFAPTSVAKRNLIKEGKKNIHLTGNTVIDALRTTVRTNYKHPVLSWAKGSRLLMLTAHRRENIGRPMQQIFQAVQDITDAYPDVKVVYPVHPNPAVQQVAYDALGSNDSVRLVEPLNVLDFHNIMARSYFILTDSGGIQEEAPSLGKPVLVLRNTTERPEGVRAGTLKLVGTQPRKLYHEASVLLENKKAHDHMSKARNPYGDGKASRRIANIVTKEKRLWAI